VTQFIDEGGELFNAITFIVFGAIILGPALKEITWQIMLYAALSLTIVRMVPVALALVSTGARRQTLAFLGWFGPRGLASIVFAVILLEDPTSPISNPCCSQSQPRSLSPSTPTASLQGH
jgi:NhaP-type Na+/H+ or K+/H+ antiporter